MGTVDDNAFYGGSSGSFGGGLSGGGKGTIWGNASSNSSSSNNKVAKDTTKAAKSAAKAADDFKEVVDEIEILLDRMDSQLSRLTDSISSYSYNLSKQSSISDEAMQMIRNNLTTLQKAYERYMQEANSIGLDASWQEKIKNGSIDIETVTDENLKTNIDDYKNWYEKALDVQNTVVELQQQLLELATQKLDNIEQYFENRTDYNDNWGYLTPIATLQEAIEKFSAELNKQVNDGIIKEFSDEWYTAQEQLAQLQQNLIEATLKKYQDIIDNLDRISTTLDNSIELKEARGDKITESDYRKPLDVNNQKINELYNKRQKLVSQQAVYDVGSDLYDDYAEQISDIDDEIYGLLIDIEDLKDKIWEVRWQPFFDGQEALSDLRSEADDLRNLLDSDAFINESGGLTADGLANLALISQGMNAAKQSIRNYQEGLKKLNEDLQAGNISTEEYEEQQKDFLDQIRSSVGVVEDYKGEIVELWTTQLKAENDVVQSSIDKHKELLQAKKDNDSYASDIRKQTKDINALQAQISALQGVNNESAKAELKRLQAQLTDAQDELSQTQKDREYEVRQSGYEGLSNDLNDALDDTLAEVTYNADKQEQVISEMLNHVVNNYQVAYDKIQSIIANSGFVPSDNFQGNISNLGSSTGVQDQVNDSNTIAPNYTPDDFVTGTNTGSIQSGASQSNNDAIESAISKEPNITNRPVAELTLNPTSVSIQEGKTTTIKVNIRPTDAANKNVSWSSSDTSIATISNGTVRGIKAGSVQITCTATDGSGKSSRCSVTVTPKPKPAPTPAPSKPTGGGDGIPKVGDKVTFKSGYYYYTSYGSSPAGNRHLGEQLYITYMNPKAPYPVHLGTKKSPGFYSDLGWVKLDQISGYATGTKSIENAIELAKVDEAGKELRIKRGGDIYEMFQYGDGVVPKHLTDNLFTLAEHKNELFESITNNASGKGNVIVNNHYDSLLTVNGDIDKETFPGVKRMLEESYQYTTKRLYKDAGLMGIQKKL